MKFPKALAIAGTAAGVSYLTYRQIADQLFQNAFCKKENVIEVDPMYREWLRSSNVLRVNLTSFDGLKLTAYNIRNHEDHRYLIMVHGIWGNKTYLYPSAYQFDQLGYNILLVDQRASGDSQGEYYTYGQKESLDLMQWIDYLRKKDPECRIILFGVSMGAATVMTAAANELPENVCCIVEDCGFSSMKEEIDHIIRKDFKLKYTGPILGILERKMQEKLQMSFDDASPKTCLENNEVPILFVHGEKDDFVPFDMAKILYNHNKGTKKYYPVKDAGHCEARNDPDYYKNIDAFITSCL